MVGCVCISVGVVSRARLAGQRSARGLRVESRRVDRAEYGGSGAIYRARFTYVDVHDSMIGTNEVGSSPESALDCARRVGSIFDGTALELYYQRSWIKLRLYYDFIVEMRSITTKLRGGKTRRLTNKMQSVIEYDRKHDFVNAVDILHSIVKKEALSKVDPEAPAAHYYLGCYYARGNGVPVNYPMAIEHLLTAANGGCVTAQRTVAECYMTGKWGFRKDRETALQYYKKAADEGNDAKSMLHLGRWYERSSIKQNLYERSSIKQNLYERSSIKQNLYEQSSIKQSLHEKVQPLSDKYYEKAADRMRDTTGTAAFNHDTVVAQEVARLIEHFKIELAIETGTFLGYTTAFLAKHVKHVITIEKSKMLVSLVQRFLLKDLTNIKFIHGSSAKILPKILKERMESYTGYVLFYLDAHSGKSNPILKELEAIATYCKNRCIVIIDDIAMPGSDLPENYEFDFAYVKQHVENLYTEQCSYRYYFDERSKLYVVPTVSCDSG